MRHAAFFRAINVGGRRVKNDQLAAAVAAAGFTEVGTFLASGNVWFEAGDLTPEGAERALEAAVLAELGFASEAFARTAEELAAIEDAVPFDAALVSRGKPQIGLMRDAPPADVCAAVAALSTDVDHLAVVGRELHWLPLGGLGRTTVDQRALGRLLPLMTVRSLQTVRRIRAKL